MDVAQALDAMRAPRVVADALHGADDGELFVERADGEDLVWESGRLRQARRERVHGFGLRAVAGEATAYAHAAQLTREALEDAARAVRAAHRGGRAGVLAPPPGRPARALYDDLDPAPTQGFDARVRALEAADAYARSRDARVREVSASLSCGVREVWVVRPDADPARDARPLTRFGVRVILEGADGRRESGFAGAGGRGDPDAWLNHDALRATVDEALRTAQVNLDARDGPAGAMDVALGPGWPGILLHEAVGHGLEGDFNRKGTSSFSGRLGERVAARGVTVIDDGAIPGRRGSLTIDDEGTPTERTTLIEDGVLKGYLHDRLNARLMGMRPTGNGRRESWASVPMPRMTNTFMLAGDADPEEIVAGVRDGVYAASFGGGQVDIASGRFVFSSSEAYRVRNGKIQEPVRGATLIGEGGDVLQRVALVGRNMSLDDGVGVCGKDGQSVPVGVGQPSLLIRGLTVGGTQT